MFGLSPPRKRFCLVRFVVDRADERLNLRAPEQTVDIVVMPHEIDRKLLRRLLLAEFCRNSLELFDERIAGIIASDGLCPVVDDRHFVGRIVVEPRADILLAVRGHVVEPEFQQDAGLEAVQGLGVGFMEEPDAARS